MPIQMYFHCRHCSDEGRPDKIAIGLVDEDTLGVHCEACDRPVGSFTLKEPIPMPACEECGKGVPHTH